MSTVKPSGMFVPSAGGERISFMGMDLVWKITSAMSRGAYVAFVQVAPPGTGVPMHVHHNEEESAFVIEGSVVLRLGDETFELGRGDMVNLPRGTPHGFRVTGGSPAQILFTIDVGLTSDYEGMFNGLVGVAATDFDRIRALTAANGVEFLLPPVMP
jgi:mannose-6-phosphate isomerase-like protein (cupin superfamily)